MSDSTESNENNQPLAAVEAYQQATLQSEAAISAPMRPSTLRRCSSVLAMCLKMPSWQLSTLAMS